MVTSTPTPADVFEAATRVAQATEWARILGTATPTPPNMVTATFTPTPVIVTNTPTPGNPATATYVALLATAQAVTTGTATPFPPDAVVLVATDTPTPTPRPAQGRPTPTPTPIFVYLEDLRPTPVPTATPPFPEALQGKILFLSDMFGTTRRPNAFVINPDGTGLALLTSRHFYDRAKARDAYSADRRFYAYALREHANGQAGLVQLFYDDALYGSSRHQLTYFGVGTAWAPAWSPVDEVVALVSSESANDEIWLVRRNEWPPRQLTHNEWEWDHSPSFSPDGSQIVFASNRVSGLRQLWIMDADGSNPRQLTFLLPYEAWDPVWVKYTDD
ncbi:MAG: hypothetical protein KatS3mg050_2814 [Litorilinea sp.]|nr:MAG: hypothetical protein KatS3mg050_2814 [Litorilinea sp.]